MRGWPEEVVTWLRENVPGRTSKEVAEIINQQGYDRKYGMTFTESMIKGAKNRYGIKSGTPPEQRKGVLSNIRKAWKNMCEASHKEERRKR